MSTSTGLKERHTEATRGLILDAAYELLTASSGHTLSHESVAERAGVGARTVYRHFPSQADLFQALWGRLRERVPPPFPTQESEITTLAAQLFERFDRNEAVIRALLASPVGTQVRDRGGVEGRAAFTTSLTELTARLDPDERARIVAVFVAVFSAPFWQLLKDRGGLSGPEAQVAVTWTMEALLASLHKEEEK